MSEATGKLLQIKIDKSHNEDSTGPRKEEPIPETGEQPPKSQGGL
jgi:hypothetical protein